MISLRADLFLRRSFYYFYPLLVEGRTKIDLELDQFSFSTHAGHDEIVAFAKATGAKHVVVYHSDPTHARPPLVAALEANGHTVHSPENGVPFVLE